MKPVVEVLCEGRIVRDGQAVLEAHSSSTLVGCEEWKVVVDTSSRQYRQKILFGLKRLGIEQDKVGFLVLTHMHGDHTGNEDLFSRAKRLGLRPNEKSRTVHPGVVLVSTPGHTPDSVSLFVESDIRYAIVGDAIPTEDNYRKWLPPGIHYDRELAMASMRSIIDFADVVIPGHGRPFRIDR